MRMISVRHNGNALLTSQEVLDELGLQPNQNVTEDQMWRIIALNAGQFCADMDVRRIAGEEGIPDTSKLKAMLASKR
jgi:hypothetical protein